MKINPLRAKLQKGETIYGTMLRDFTTSPEICEFLSRAGFDYVIVDGEHSPCGYETINQLVLASRPAGVAFLARVSDATYTLVARMLDTGVEGIMAPRVEDKKTVEEVVAAAKYPPIGRRGFGLRDFHLGDKPVAIPEAIAHFNENTVVIIQIESQKALDNLDEMLSVPGVDVALVGPTDLSISLGCPGESEHPRMEEALQHVVAVCQRKGVAPGVHFPVFELSKKWHAKGMRFVMCSSDGALFNQAAKELARKLRSELL